MKRTFLLILLIAAGCAKKDEPQPAEEKKSEAPWKLSRNTNGEPVITLDEATRMRIGLKVAPFAVAQLAPEVKGFGRVVDPVLLQELLAEWTRATLAFDNSHQELERLKVLRKDNNTSERAFQAAEANYLQHLTDINAVWLKLEKTYGGRIAVLTGPRVVPLGTERKLDPLMDQIVYTGGARLVRVDLPASGVLDREPVAARIVGQAEGATPVPAVYIGAVPAVDSQTQTRGFFFVVTTNTSQLTPGAAVTAWIDAGGMRQKGVVVPGNAIIRFKGAAWLYLQTGEGTFVRQVITLDRPLADGWFVRDGLKGEAKVVTTGAQQLLSEELKEQIGGD